MHCIQENMLKSSSEKDSHKSQKLEPKKKNFSNQLTPCSFIFKTLNQQIKTYSISREFPGIPGNSWEFM